MRRLAMFFLLGILMAGCSAQPPAAPIPTRTPLPSTVAEAYAALVNFLTLLHQKSYSDAVSLYGGEYDQLQVFNPEIDPNDHVALWKWVCENQLLQCLEVRSATFQELRGDSYIFQVEFNQPDGSLFVLGPCCGANETEMPPLSQFEYTVTRNMDGRFVVMNTPPYMP